MNFNDKIFPQLISINISDGGIPKYPIESTIVNEGGLVGDGHNHEKHCRPIQAISLQDIEQLIKLGKAGYRINAGATGENLTVRNLDVNDLPIGTRLKFSGGVVIELSKVRQPCYVLDSIDPNLKKDIIGHCGYYAKVITEGRISVFETIKIEDIKS